VTGHVADLALAASRGIDGAIFLAPQGAAAVEPQRLARHRRVDVAVACFGAALDTVAAKRAMRIGIASRIGAICQAVPVVVDVIVADLGGWGLSSRAAATSSTTRTGTLRRAGTRSDENGTSE